jgi:hypothetical protein
LTGRANYQRFGDLLDVDLVAEPPRAAMPDVAFRVAGLFWSKKGLNELADLATPEAFKLITKRINGGTNGLAERRAFYAVARTVLGVVEAPSPRGSVRGIGPKPAKEPTFNRGAEAIRAYARARRRRTKRPVKKRRATKRIRKPSKLR